MAQLVAARKAEKAATIERIDQLTRDVDDSLNEVPRASAAALEPSHLIHPDFLPLLS